MSLSKLLPGEERRHQYKYQEIFTSLVRKRFIKENERMILYELTDGMPLGVCRLALELQNLNEYPRRGK